MDKDTKHILTGAGITAGVVALGYGIKKAYDAYTGKKDDAAANTPMHEGGAAPLETDGTIENEYTIPGAFALELNQLPVLRPQMDSTAGSSFIVTGDDAASSVGEQFDANAKASGMSAEAYSSWTKSQDFLATMVKGLPGELADAKAQGEQLPDVLFVVLSGAQPRSMIPGSMGSVAAYRANIMAIRQIMPKTSQRVLWLLTSDAPPQLAKALNEAGEEWYRSVSPSAPASAPAFWNVATAISPQMLAAAASGTVTSSTGI